MLGMTWQATLDAALDEISRREKERQAALDAIARCVCNRPELEQDDDIVTARATHHCTVCGKPHYSSDDAETCDHVEAEDS